MEKVLFPIQRRLFELITNHHGSQAKAVQYYTKHYSASKSTAYAKFNGSSAIDGDHFFKLMSDYGVHDLDVWPQGWPDTHFVVTAPSLQPDLDAYLTMLKYDLNDLSNQPTSCLLHATNDLSLLLLKTRRSLAGFLLYYYFKYEQPNSRFKDIKFGKAFLHDAVISNWLDQCRDALLLYHQIPGVEYWSSHMLDALIVKINFVQDAEDFDASLNYQEVTGEIHQLVNEMEKMAENGRKLGGAPLEIYNHRGLLRNDLIIGHSERSNFLYHDCGLLDMFRNQTCTAIHTRLSSISGLNDILPRLNGDLIARRIFFTNLRDNIKRGLYATPNDRN